MKTDGVSGGGIKAQMPSEQVRVSSTAAAASEDSLDRQLQAWRDNPSWTDQPPEIKVLVFDNELRYKDCDWECLYCRLKDGLIYFEN